MSSCDEFFGRIKTILDFLFKDFGFSWLSNNDEELGFGNCVVILKSDSCCIEIIKDRGSILIKIGHCSTKNKNSYYIDYVIDFLNKDINGEKRKQEQKKVSESIDKSNKYDYTEYELISWANKLKTYGKEIFYLFQKDTFKKNELELKEFIKICREERFKKLSRKKCRSVARH